MRKYLLHTMLLFLSSYYVFAQEVKCSLTASSEENKKYIIVENDSYSFHVVESAKCTYNLSASDGKNYTNIKWFGPILKKDGEKYPIENWDKPYLEVLSFVINESGRYELFLDSVTYKSNDKENTIRYEDKNKPTSIFSTTIYKAPSIKEIANSYPKVIWNNTTGSIIVKHEGGYDNGWKYTWKLNGYKEGDDNIWEQAISAIGQQVLTCEIENVTPDNATTWFKDTLSYKFTVYPYPMDDNITLKFKGKECPEEMDWFCEDTSHVGITIETSNHDGYNWKYEWKNERELIECTDSCFRPSIMEEKEYKFMITATNCPAGMPDSIAYKSQSKEYTVRFWKTPSVMSNFNDAVFESDVVDINMKIEGRISNYSYCHDLYIEGTPIKSIQNSSLIQFTSPFVDKQKETMSYSIKTNLRNDYSSVSVDTTIYLTVWNTPTVKRKYKSNNTRLKDTILLEEEEPIIICNAFDGAIILSIDTENGADNCWSYYWSDYSGNPVGENSSYSFNVENEDEGEFQYNLVIKNSPENVNKPYTKTLQYKGIIYPTPEIKLKKIENLYGLNSGEKTVKIVTESLKPNEIGKWRYKWLEKGSNEIEEIEIDSFNINFSLNNPTEKEEQEWAIIPIFYGPEGDVWFEGDSTIFNVVVYPNELTKPEEQGDSLVRVRELDNVSLTLNHPKGYNSEGWQYQWGEDSENPDPAKWEEVKHNEKISYTPSNRNWEWNGKGKDSIEKKISYYYRNMAGDMQTELLEPNRLDFMIKIYRKPQVEKFQKKGDGTSNIYIAYSSWDNPKFEFGSEEPPTSNDSILSSMRSGGLMGDTIQNGWIAYRYSESPSTPWVRTYWEYEHEDGIFRCYSDALIYKPSEVPIFSRELKIENGYFYVNLKEEAPATVRLYTMDGKVVRTQNYPPQIDFNEKLNLNGLTPGIYILKCVVGELQIVKKIVVQ